MRTMDLPSTDDVRNAARRIAPHVIRTPLVRLPWDGPCAVGDEVYVKAENLQRTGSFKLRGAMNFLARMSSEERAGGVVTHSSGNHGQAVACAAATFGVRATVVIPRGAPEVKVRRTEAWGATVLRCDDSAASRLATAQEVANESGATIVPPFDHPWIVEGQGTAGLEIVEDLPSVANVLSCVGGGGLAAGLVTALASAAPDAHVIGVEPELAADALASLEAGHAVSWPAEATTRTIADGVRTQMLGAVPFEILHRGLAGIVTVTEPQIVDAARWWIDCGRLVAEPTGSLPLAALRRLLAGEVDGLALKPGPTVILITGGNVDVAWLRDAALVPAER